MLRNIYAYLNLFQLTFWKDFRTLWKLNLPLSKLWPQAIGTLTLSKLASRRFSVKSAISGSQARMPWQSTYLYTRARPNVNTARLHSPPFPTLTSTWESITVTWMCYPTTMIRKCTFENVENKAFNKLSNIVSVLFPLIQFSLFSGGGWFPEVASAATQCDQCYKVFTNRNAYTNHLPSHEGKTICKHCGKFFSSPSNLNKHIRKNHIFSTHMESHETVNKFSWNKAPSSTGM